MESLETIVQDLPTPCPYLPERTARLPLRLPLTRLTPEQLDKQLAEGDRRYGVFLYRPQCERCQACQPIRLETFTFRPDATQRRMQRRGDAILECEIGPPHVDSERIDLFNLHRQQRGLADGDDRLQDECGYREFFTNSCCPTVELSCRYAGRLVACAIADEGSESLSAVYTFYDPGFPRLSLGTYCILRQVEFCRDTGRRFLYLGLFIADSPHMSYKSRFLPHERRIEGEWIRFAELPSAILHHRCQS